MRDAPRARGPREHPCYRLPIEHLVTSPHYFISNGNWQPHSRVRRKRRLTHVTLSDKSGAPRSHENLERRLRLLASENDFFNTVFGWEIDQQLVAHHAVRQGFICASAGTAGSVYREIGRRRHERGRPARNSSSIAARLIEVISRDDDDGASNRKSWHIGSEQRLLDGVSALAPVYARDRNRVRQAPS